jgi:GNAT superfamily N-acetyltransferase
MDEKLVIAMTVDVIPPAYSWRSQARQYAAFGESGVRLEAHYVDLDTGEEVFPQPQPVTDPSMTKIDCLLYRDDEGALAGILNHYDGRNPMEKADAINLWVRPDMQRKGIAKELVLEAKRLWPAIKPQEQRYTPDGLKLLVSLLTEYPEYDK